MKLKWLLLNTVIAVGLMVLSSCARFTQATPTPTTVLGTPVAPTEEPSVDVPLLGVADVESIEIMILESFPVQINVLVRGNLTDACTTTDEINTTRSGNAFQVQITTIRPPGSVCAAALVPFEEAVSLDVVDLDAGAYTVNVNGVNGAFTLAVDNRLPEETEAVDTETALISGVVWHDLCAVAGGEGGEEAVPSEGCVAAPDGGFQANGVLDDGEPGIEGVTVSLGEGECPGTELATTITDADGQYSFTGLGAGTYCVSIDALDGDNNEILLPGIWTFPDVDVSSVTVELEMEESQLDTNFGWDYQFLPLPEVDLATCRHSIEFIDDVTVPDGTVFAPGEAITKTWRLRNDGTCPWTTEYSLVYVGGDQLLGPEAVPLRRPVAPGQPVDLTVTLTAPAEPGAYRSNWQISDASGAPFGINGFIEDAFWVEIIVSETATPQAASTQQTASIGGVLWADVCRLQADGTPTAGCVETAEGSGVYRANGTFDRGEQPISGVTVTLSNGPCPDDGIIRPASVISTTLTDADGLYTFTGLDADVFCVSIDALSAENVNLLIPGDWTYPAFGTGRLGVRLAAGEERRNVDFGWEHR